MIIAIPSYKRAKKCLSAKILSNAMIFCHEFEFKEYSKYNKNVIAVIPDDLASKGMGVIRNFMLDFARTQNDDILMIDDDIKRFGRYEDGKGIEMDENDFYAFAENAFRMTKELGTKLWGMAMLPDKRVYQEFKPFNLGCCILGPCMGIIPDDTLRFDESLGLKEDYDYSLQVLNKCRKVLRFNAYHYYCGHKRTKGGCRSYRNIAKEQEQMKLFIKKWGSHIVKNPETSYGNYTINPRITSPIKGI